MRSSYSRPAFLDLIQRSSIPWPCQPALSGRNSPIVNRSAAMVRASGVAGIRNAGEADAGGFASANACSATLGARPNMAVVE